MSFSHPIQQPPGSQSIVLRDGDFSTLDSFNHLSEQYQLSAGLLVDREALLRGTKATVTVRPALRLNGRRLLHPCLKIYASAFKQQTTKASQPQPKF